jgi:hypothetical protein
MNTDDLLKVMREYTGHVTHVQVPASKDCTTIWKDLTAAVYYATSDKTFIAPKLFEGFSNSDAPRCLDYYLRNAMRQFENEDSLEILNKKGRILKRFANYFKRETGCQLDNSVLGIIGDKIQYYLNQESHDYYIDFTDEIDWRDGQFGKSDSCWWGCYSDSRPTYTQHGGWGIRFYRSENPSYDNGIGRTWVYPHDGMLFCFNSYGQTRSEVSKVIKEVFAKHDITLHYKVIEISNSCNSDIPYVNGGSGFVLYPHGMTENEIPDEYDLDMEHVRIHSCDSCGRELDDDNCYSYDDNDYCERCYDRYFRTCECCGETYRKDDIHSTTGESDYSELCEYCANRHGYVLCVNCGQYTQSHSTDENDNDYCERCAENLLSECEFCHASYRYYHECSDCLDTTGLIVTHESEYNVVVYGEPRIENLDVYRVDSMPGIGMIKFSSTWKIIHEQSGLAIFNSMSKFTNAKNCLLALAEIKQDWTVPVDEIGSNDTLLNKICKIRSQYLY